MPVAFAVGHELVRALSFAGGMAWEILWALILGFARSGVVSSRSPRCSSSATSVAGAAYGCCG